MNTRPASLVLLLLMTSLLRAQAVESLGVSRGRIDVYFRFSPPRDLSGSGDILIQFEGGKATRVVLLSPSFHLPPAWEWGQSSSSGPEGRP